MNKLNFTVIEQKESQTIWGLRSQSNDKTQSKDIPALSKKYHAAIGKNRDEEIPFFILSQDYNQTTRDFQLMIGGLTEHVNLEIHEIPKGLYGKITVKPKLGFLWGLAIGEAKKSFYTAWLPQSDYVPLNMEYEYHTEASLGKNPQIELLFAIRKK
jgi:hypothetical protein